MLDEFAGLSLALALSRSLALSLSLSLSRSLTLLRRRVPGPSRPPLLLHAPDVRCVATWPNV